MYLIFVLVLCFSYLSFNFVDSDDYVMLSVVFAVEGGDQVVAAVAGCNRILLVHHGKVPFGELVHLQLLPSQLEPLGDDPPFDVLFIFVLLLLRCLRLQHYLFVLLRPVLCLQLHFLLDVSL